MASTSGRPSADVNLDHVVSFLQRREGIDKTLKIIRYTSRLIAATSIPGSAAHARFAALEKSVGVSRSGFDTQLFPLLPVQHSTSILRCLPGIHTYKIGIADSPFSVAACRKAYRLGKFLQDVQYLRKSKATGLVALLELIAFGGEGIYYFIERKSNAAPEVLVCVLVCEVCSVLGFHTCALHSPPCMQSLCGEWCGANRGCMLS